MHADPTPAAWPAGVPRHLDLPDHGLAQNLALTAARTPEAPALIYHGATISYGDLDRRARAMAGWLQQAAGVAEGEPVLLFMQNCPQFVIGYYAILRANAVVVPVNPMSRHDDLSMLLADTGARVALVGQELLPELLPLPGAAGPSHVVVAAAADMADPDSDIPLPPGLERRGLTDYGHPALLPWARAEGAGLAPGPLTSGPDDLAVIAYTSGTTGRPKGCMHTHRMVQATALGGLRWNPQGLGGGTLAVLPLYHVTGMQNSMNGPIICGDPIVLMSRWDRRAATRLIARHRVTRWRSIATMMIDLLNDPALCAEDLASLRNIGGGGASMPAPVAARLRALTGLDYVEGYGLTETMGGALINPADAPRPQCLGIPVFDVDARVIDAEGRELGPDAPGEIVLAGPQVFAGYWRRPEATEAAFLIRDGKRFLRTGDVGRRDADGYFYILDRLKRMINAAGFKVWPTEIEAMLHEHPQVAEACVVACPDPRRGETVLAYVVPQGGLTEAALLDWCQRRMAAYKRPRRVVFLDALPRSGSGKVEWLALQACAAAEADGRSGP